MKVIETAAELISWRATLKPELKVGFVPTMGALHAGHASLLGSARKECDIVIASVFVNPTQFDNLDDLKNYPRTWDEDKALLIAEGTDVVFLPKKTDLYPDDYRYRISENDLSLKYCGAHRPGHFDGVLSVVMKLFQVTRPHLAYFGEKDFQQMRLIEGMIQAFFLPITLRRCPTLRETDGLAMSSRNRRLSPSERTIAPMFSKILKESKTTGAASELLEKS
ncbi:MAG: pantoate--beta-alanine ligase, partial [Bdellovibrionales bacterium]|nr:pantoate--beta-alanine ligase [Bdellovibrionales bacterium]